MKPIRKVLEKFHKGELSIDEAEGEIDWIVMSWDCPKEKRRKDGLVRKSRKKSQ